MLKHSTLLHPSSARGTERAPNPPPSFYTYMSKLNPGNDPEVRIPYTAHYMPGPSLASFIILCLVLLRPHHLSQGIAMNRHREYELAIGRLEWTVDWTTGMDYWTTIDWSNGPGACAKDNW